MHRFCSLPGVLRPEEQGSSFRSPYQPNTWKGAPHTAPRTAPRHIYQALDAAVLGMLQGMYQEPPPPARTPLQVHATPQPLEVQLVLEHPTYTPSSEAGTARNPEPVYPLPIFSFIF